MAVYFCALKKRVHPEIVQYSPPIVYMISSERLIWLSWKFSTILSH